MLVRWIADKSVYAAMATMLLLAQAVSATTPLPTGFVDASIYGGGYNETDSTAALQAAINTGRNVYVRKMAAAWIVTPILINTSNQQILFEDGVVIAAKPGAFLGTNDSLFTLGKGSSNVSMVGYGATLTMRKDDYTKPPYQKGEWRSGITLLGATNAVLKGLSITNTGGDGVYVGGSDNGRNYSQNVTIKDVVVDKAYRNGISVVSAKELLIDNVVIVNTSGTDPQAGIDFEPNANSERIENCTVRNTIVAGNAKDGIDFTFHNYSTKSVSPATVTVEHVTVVGNKGKGIAIGQIVPGLTIKDALIVNNGSRGLLSGVSDKDGEASGRPRNAVTYSDLWGNMGGAAPTYGWVTLGAGTQTVAPKFHSTDINSPDYMYLDASCSPLITRGASDGGHMGARGVK
jgi:hypothetical protein